MPKTTAQGATPRAPLSRERVLLAAVRLADDSGITSLSMRKLAQTLSVEAMSLYNYVKSKDDLFDGMVELVAGEIEAPTIGGDWNAAMRRRANSAHAVLLRHPWATKLIVSRVNVGPTMLHYVDATIGCLRQAGFSPPMADHAWNAIDSHIYGFTLQELNFPIQEEEYAQEATTHLPLIPADEYPHLHELAQLVAKKRYDGLHDFEFGLGLILDSLDELRDEA